MKVEYIEFPSAETVQNFVDRISELDGIFELVSDGYILDARSMMGIFSLNLSKPIELRIYNDCDENLEAIEEFISK